MSNHSSVHWNAWVWIQEQSWFQDPFLHIFYWEKTERFFLSVMLFSGFYYLICLLKNRMTDNIIMIRNKPKLKISRYSIPVPILFPSCCIISCYLFLFMWKSMHKTWICIPFIQEAFSQERGRKWKVDTTSVVTDSKNALIKLRKTSKNPN